MQLIYNSLCAVLCHEGPFLCRSKARVNRVGHCSWRESHHAKCSWHFRFFFSLGILCFGRTVSVAQDGSGEFLTIQAAIDASSAGDEIVVAPGRYVESVALRGADIVLRSTDPWSRAVVERTIIDAGGADHAVVFAGTESAACRLEGFVITGGHADLDDGTTSHQRAGGILGNGASAVVNRCIIRGNKAQLTGGAVWNFAGTISNCRIEDNHASSGALAACSGRIVNCVITGNTVGLVEKGVLHNCGAIVNCTVVDNPGGGSSAAARL